MCGSPSGAVALARGLQALQEEERLVRSLVVDLEASEGAALSTAERSSSLEVLGRAIPGTTLLKLS